MWVWFQTRKMNWFESFLTKGQGIKLKEKMLSQVIFPLTIQHSGNEDGEEKDIFHFFEIRRSSHMNTLWHLEVNQISTATFKLTEERRDRPKTHTHTKHIYMQTSSSFMCTNNHSTLIQQKPPWKSSRLLNECNSEQADGSCQLMISI